MSHYLRLFFTDTLPLGALSCYERDTSLPAFVWNGRSVEQYAVEGPRVLVEMFADTDDELVIRALILHVASLPDRQSSDKLAHYNPLEIDDLDWGALLHHPEDVVSIPDTVIAIPEPAVPRRRAIALTSPELLGYRTRSEHDNRTGFVLFNPLGVLNLSLD